MARRLLLHAGVSKTGTTSLQNWLAAQRSALAGRGVHVQPLRNFWGVAVFGGDRDFDCQPLRARGFKTREDVAAAKAKFTARFESWAAGIPDGATAIISTEGLSALNDREVRSLKAFLEPYFSEITPILYIRHPAAWVPSVFGQRVRGGAKAFISWTQLTRNFGDLADRFHSTFGAVDLRQYRSDVDVREDFAAAYGLPAEGFPVDRSNPSLTADCIRFALQMNSRLGLDEPRRRKIIELLETHGTGPRLRLSETSIKEVEASCAQWIDHVRDTYGLRLTPPKPDPDTDDVSFSRISLSKQEDLFRIAEMSPDEIALMRK